MKKVLGYVFWPIAILMSIAAILWNFNPFGMVGALYTYFVVGYIETAGDRTIILHIILGLILLSYPAISFLDFLKNKEDKKILKWFVASLVLAFLAFQVLLIN